MKLNNCRSEKFLPSPKQQSSPEDSLTEDSPQICQLLQKLHNLQERQQKTKTLYLNKIQQLKTVLAQQNLTTINLQDYLRELRKENQKQLAYLDDMKREILKELNQGQTIGTPTGLEMKKSIDIMGKGMELGQSEREKSGGKGGLRLLKSMNLRDENRSSSKSNSRSKLSLFKASSTLFRKNSQTLLKKYGSTRDLIKIQSEYFQQNPKKY